MAPFQVNSVSLLLIFYWCSLGGGTSLNRTVRQVDCRDKFSCPQGRCVETTDVCNGRNDCPDGYDESAEACDCGLRSSSLRPNQFSGALRDATSGANPWHVGIYRARINNHYTLICGGALIYNDIVLTSANCVIDPESHLPYQTSAIHVSAGNLKKDFNVGETFQQTFQVQKIVTLDRYEGDTKGYARNLAIVKLKQAMKSSHFVRPVCLWTDKTFPLGISAATITGWGLQSGGNYGTALREAEGNLMDIGSCIRTFYDALFKRFLTNDKFCLTFDRGISLKDEDTGGPVTVSHQGRYYLLGVISVKLREADFSIATKISKHLNWIRNTVYSLKEVERCQRGHHFNCHSDSKCIFLDKLCNGVSDCTDSSDETPSLCKEASKPPTSSDGPKCRFSETGEVFKVLKCGDSDNCKSKYLAPANSKYQITCPDGYGFAKPNTEAVTVVCTSDGEWVPSLEENRCLTLCPGLDYKTLQLRCSYQGLETSCHKLLKPGTSIRVSCKNQFKIQPPPVRYTDSTVCRRDGSLKHILSECTPVCGVPYDIGKVTQLISNGQNVKYAKYPWHTALYWKKTDDNIDFVYQCGGTLIDTNKILTAGHCVWDVKRNSVVPAETLAVVLGKFYSNWLIKDALEQRHSVYKIILGDHYNGAKTKHAQDIAVLVLNKHVELSDYVMPACLDLDSLAGGIPANQLGHVVGWGRLSENDDKPSDVLMETWMKYLDLDSCRKTFAKYSFDEYLLTDKFCVLYNNGSGTQMGDSGGGLTFIHDKLHYVYGVVSIKKSKQDKFAAFTNVQYHREWLKNILRNE